MIVANATRATIFVGAILLVAAVAVDKYLTADYKSTGAEIDAKYGAFNVDTKMTLLGISQDKKESVNCDQGDISSECVDSCRSKKAFAIMAVIFAWLSVFVTSSFPDVHMATTNHMRTVLSGVMTQIATLSVLITLVMFGVEKRVKQTSAEPVGVCAYNMNQGESVDLGASYIIMIVGGALCGLAGTIQLAVSPDRNIDVMNHMAYGHM